MKLLEIRAKSNGLLLWDARGCYYEIVSYIRALWVKGLLINWKQKKNHDHTFNLHISLTTSRLTSVLTTICTS